MNIGITFLGILIVAGLIIVPVVVMALIGRRSKGARWILAVCLLAVVGIAALVLFPVTFVRTQKITRVGVVPEYSRAVQKIPEAGPWSAEVGRTFLADIYPSEGAAAEAMGRELVTTLTAAPRKDGQPWRVGVSGSISPEAMKRVSDVIRNLNEVEAVEVSDTGAVEKALKTGQFAIAIQIDVIERSGQNSKEGAIHGVAKANQREESRTVRFIDKPWVENFTGFLDRDPKKNWVVAVSDRACTAHQEAKRRAIEIAAGKIANMLRPDIAHAHPGVWNGSQNRIDPRWLQSRIEADMSKGVLLADQFAQRFHRPYGRTWGAAPRSKRLCSRP